MSGQQEQREGPEQSSQPDPLDATLVMAEPSARGQDRANGHARPIGTGAAAHGETTGRHRSPRSLFDPGPAEQPAVAAGARARAPSAGDSPARQIDQPNRTPVPGSWADLSQRLERLPYGHPSSPYHVDGERKPPPPRLIHLELAPPVRATTPRPSSPELPDVD